MMLKKYIITASILIALSALNAVAQPLTLEECRAMALTNNKKLLSNDLSIEKSNDMLSAYKTNRLPNLSLSSNFLYSTASYTASVDIGILSLIMPTPEYEFEVDFAFNANLVLTQPIYMGGKINSAIKLANIGVDVAELNRRQTEAEILVETDQAFYTFLKVEELLKSAEKYHDVITEFHRQMTNACNEGMTTRNELLKVEVRLNEAKLMLKQSENGLRLARMNLCYAIGMPLTTQELSIVDNFDTELALITDKADITNRPEYAMLEKQIEAKALETKLARSEYLPSIAALASYGYINGATINEATLLDSDSFIGGVTISVPIFHWGQGRKKISASKREEAIAQYQLEDMSQLMTLEMMQAANQYDEASFEAVLCEESLVQATENMRLSLDKYNQGMETLGDYLESQALWQKSMSDLVEARSSQRVSYSKYLKSIGAL
ncbi:MAG: TolC family protein [Rikenellaceae bacterium]